MKSSLLLLCAFLGLLSIGGQACAASHATEAPGTVLITGSNRGIGLAFAGEYAERGWRVIATCRTPARAAALNKLASEYPLLTVEALDITDAGQIVELDKRYADVAIDVLINNAAYLGATEPQQFGSLDYKLFADIVDVNLLGPLRVSEAFLDQVLASQQKKIIILGSAASSNGLLGPGMQLYAYRSSKAGLHLAAHRMAMDLAPRGIIVALINPGLVDTKGLLDLKPGDPVPEVFKPLLPLIESGDLELSRPAESAAAMATIIDGLGSEDAGKFIDVDGQILPW